MVGASSGRRAPMRQGFSSVQMPQMSLTSSSGMVRRYCAGLLTTARMWLTLTRARARSTAELRNYPAYNPCQFGNVGSNGCINSPIVACRRSSTRILCSIDPLNG